MNVFATIAIVTFNFNID